MLRSQLIEFDPSSPWKLIDVEEIANAMGFLQTLCALAFSSGLHEGLRRKDGRGNFVHSYRLAQILIYLGVYDDDILAAAILHDVVEDVRIVSIRDIASDFNPRVTALVARLTIDLWSSHDQYYKAIFNDPDTMLIKMVDRFHNLRNLRKYYGRIELGKFFARQKVEIKVVDTLPEIIARFPGRAVGKHDEVAQVIMFRILEVIADLERKINADLAGSAKHLSAFFILSS